MEIPVPVRFTTKGEFSAVLLIVRLPLAAPAALGPNVAFSVMVCPLLNVTGAVRPVTANGPEAPTELMVIDPAPLFEISMD